MADNNALYEERIASLETRIGELETQKIAMLQALQDLSARIEKLEGQIGADFANAAPAEAFNADAAPAEIDTSADVPADTDTSADISANIADVATAAVDTAKASSETANTGADKTAADKQESSENLEDKYASEEDTKFDPSTLDPELLKFFESVSSDVAKSTTEKASSAVNTDPQPEVKAPAPKPVKKTIMRRPGFHLYNWFYYSNQKDHGKLYRMKEDGTQNERMTDYPVDLSVFKFKSGHLYFRDTNWAERTIRLSNEALDAYDLETEVDMGNVRLNGFRHNGWFYYANPYMGYFLYRVKEDGTCHQRLTEYTLPRTQTFRVLNNDLCFYDDFYNPHQIPIRQ